MVLRRLRRIGMILFRFRSAIITVAIERALFNRHFPFNFRHYVSAYILGLSLYASYTRSSNHRRGVARSRRNYVVILVLVEIVPWIPRPQIGMFISPLTGFQILMEMYRRPLFTFSFPFFRTCYKCVNTLRYTKCIHTLSSINKYKKKSGYTGWNIHLLCNVLMCSFGDSEFK